MNIISVTDITKTYTERKLFEKASFYLQDKVVIGDIMPLVPGIALTTSIRDFFNGDYLSGAIHMIDAILTAFSIAVGVGAVITLYQLVTGGALLR